MGSKILSWYLCWTLTCSCRIGCYGTQSSDRSCIAAISWVFDDLFTTVLFMEKSEVPPNWADLVEKSREKVTDEHYDLAKTWLFSDPEPADISMPERNSNASTDPNLGSNSNITMLPTGIEPHCLFSSSDKTSGLSQNDDYVPHPFLHPVLSNSAGKNLVLQIEDPLLVPRLINLETSGLRRSKGSLR
jgi:hypothetical protein